VAKKKVTSRGERKAIKKGKICKIDPGIEALKKGQNFLHGEMTRKFWQKNNEIKPAHIKK